MGPHEPYWRTNTSFSPPPSRWDIRFQSEGMSVGSHDGIQFYASSTSSNSRGSRGWMRGNHLSNHQYSTSDGVGPYFSSPSDISPAQHWAPPRIQEINVDDYGTSSRRDAVSGPITFSPTMERPSVVVQDSRGSTSSRSDSSEYDTMPKSQSHRNFSSRRCFMSKPIYPLSLPYETPTTDVADSTTPAGFSLFDVATPQRDAHRLSNASGSFDLTDVSEPLGSDFSRPSCNTSDEFKCVLCERFLSQRSPWSSRRIVRSGDMPVAGILSCRHVFHAECLEQTTPKTRKHDPPCPLCVRSLDGDYSPEQQRVFSKLRNGFPKLKPTSEEGPSRPWGCAQAGDCVEGALNAPSRNTMLLLNRNRIKKNLSLRGNSGKEFPGKLRKNDSFPSQLIIGSSVDRVAVGSSKTTSSPNMN